MPSNKKNNDNCEAKMSTCAHTKTQISKLNLVQLQQGLKLQKLLSHERMLHFNIHRSIQLVHKIDFLVVLGSRQCSTQNLISILLLTPTPTLAFIVSRPKPLRYQSQCSIRLWYIWQDFEIQCFIPSSYWQLCTSFTLQRSYGRL